MRVESSGVLTEERQPEATTAMGDADVLDSREAGGKVIRGGGLRVSSYVFSLGIGLLSAPLLVRYLSIEDFGLFVTVSSIAFVVAGVTEGGFSAVAVRTYAVSSSEDRARLLDALLGLRVVLTTLGVAIAIGFTVVAGYPSEVTIGTAIAGAGIFIGAWQNTLVVALQSELKLGSVAAAMWCARS